MKFNVTQTYSRSAGAVFATLTDFDEVREKYEALGHSDVELVSREEGTRGEVTLVTRRVVPLELPGFAKRFLSPHQTVTQTDTWTAADGDGVRTGTFAVVGKGTPVQVHGTMRLAPKGTRRCSNCTYVTVECKIPLIGGKIADFVAGDTRRAVDHEQTWIREHLAAS
ncbi:MAG: DUF2505 domain-containing protein [Ilumatobacteraceae bacterium]